MKNFPIVVLVVSIALVMVACSKEDLVPTIKASKTITTVTKDITDFNALNINSGFEVFLTFSDTEESIVVEANENLQDLILLEKIGTTLDIGFANSIRIKGKQTTKVYITTKEIIDFQTNGQGIFYLENQLTADKVKLDLGSGGEFTGALDINELSAAITVSTKLNLEGHAKRVVLKMGGNSQLKDYEFSCNQLDVEMTGKSEAFLTVLESVNVKASGKCILHYKGEGTVDTEQLTGDARVEKEG